MQRGGLYSVVPRVPGGEITPEKLAVLARVAKKYGLYTKITGGQRIDLFGARVQDLPDIWEELVDAGFESGHAYGKALRTVKSCVGTTWCRYGVQDSVGFAIRVENRYKGIRAPHKIKMAVSGCIRECAEAQSKDVGLIATEKGYNLYVCGNGGSKPRHADLLATDLDEETALKYIDRFLMYYIMTADRLTRTSVWLREARRRASTTFATWSSTTSSASPRELDAMMQHLVDTYQCEWAAVVRDPEKRKRFRQFVNTRRDGAVHRDRQRARAEPSGRLAERVRLAGAVPHARRPLARRTRARGRAGAAVGAGRQRGRLPARRRRDGQVRQVADRGVQLRQPRRVVRHARTCARTRRRSCCRAASSATPAGEPKVACPLHKKTFSLETGESLQGEEYRIRTFPVKVEGEQVYVELPPPEVLDPVLATEIGCQLASLCDAHADGRRHRAVGVSV